MKIDIDYLKETIDDDPDFLMGVLETFEKDIKLTLPEFKELHGTEDVYLMGRKAHKLLSSSQLFNLSAYSESLKKLETLSDEGNAQKCNAQLELVIRSSEECIEALEDARNQLK